MRRWTTMQFVRHGFQQVPTQLADILLPSVNNTTTTIADNDDDNNSLETADDIQERHELYRELYY
ncbi:unnamed protein product, partial [Didymodactylos carnosus]